MLTVVIICVVVRFRFEPAGCAPVLAQIEILGDLIPHMTMVMTLHVAEAH